MSNAYMENRFALRNGARNWLGWWPVWAPVGAALWSALYATNGDVGDMGDGGGHSPVEKAVTRRFFLI
jgi:hypothetical protein